MFGSAIALRRLRAYERECRRQAADASDDATKVELTKLADCFHEAIQRQDTVPRPN